MTPRRPLVRIASLAAAVAVIVGLGVPTPDEQAAAAASPAARQVLPTLMPAPGADDAFVLYPPVHFTQTPLSPEDLATYQHARATMIAPAVHQVRAGRPSTSRSAAGPAAAGVSRPRVELLVSPPSADTSLIGPAPQLGGGPGSEVVLRDPVTGLTLVVAGDVDCSDFPSQAVAQAALRAFPSDPLGVDPDRDGIACEDNPPPRDLVPVPR